ncbi:S24 family peptidase [Plantibacter sp. YIM 135249]|uniref:S24 family peptidase n=1 Tax=Plantibacter sp. YIM 135249 TaxID=3423918 RepID=UPI003D32A3B0
MKLTLLVARVVAVVALLILAAPFAWERITGDYFMTVTGASMRPAYQVGDVLVVQKPTGTELQTQDQIVVVSVTPGNKAQQYVHRVHEITDAGTTLKGDGNEIADPSPVTQAQVMGTPRLAIQGSTAVLYHLTQNLYGRIALVALIVPAFLFSTPKKPRGRRAAGQPVTVAPERTAAAPSTDPSHATGIDAFDAILAPAPPTRTPQPPDASPSLTTDQSSTTDQPSTASQSSPQTGANA